MSKQTFVSSECLTPISLFSLLCFALMPTAATAVDSIQKLVMHYLQPEPFIWLCLWFLVRTVHHRAVKSEAHNRSLKEQWALSAPIPLAGSLLALPSWPSSLSPCSGSQRRSDSPQGWTVQDSSSRNCRHGSRASLHFHSGTKLRSLSPFFPMPVCGIWMLIVIAWSLVL